MGNMVWVKQMPSLQGLGGKESLGRSEVIYKLVDHKACIHSPFPSAGIFRIDRFAHERVQRRIGPVSERKICEKAAGFGFSLDDHYR